jgi:rod shape determining protein RodA
MTSSQLASAPAPVRALFYLFAEVDWLLVMATGFLIYVGLTTLQYQGHGTFHEKQMQFLLAGLVALVIFWRIPYKLWTHKFVLPFLYLANIGLLGAVMVVGHSAMGAQRWIALGPITLQPSEIAKLVVIFTLSAWLGWRPVKSFWDNFVTALLIAVPAVLVFKQPDLGTSLTFGAVFFGMTFWAGAAVLDLIVLLSPVISLIINALSIEAWKLFLVALGIILVLFWRTKDWRWWTRIILALAVVGVNYGFGEARPSLWNVLKPYQQKRLTSFVNPYSDPRGSGYHILQSLIAIGSGGIQGQGLGKGNQSQGAFIPERHTDFIFAVVGEELGFRATALVVLSYLMICFRGIMIAYQARMEPVGSLMATGLTFMFLFHVFLNIGMTMGIMPVAGVPLPFLSYGGTALIIDMIAIGILLSIRALNPPPKKDIWQ